MLLVIAALFHGKVGGAGERLAVFMIIKAGVSKAPQGWSGHTHQGHKAAENLVRTQCVKKISDLFFSCEEACSSCSISVSVPSGQPAFSLDQ